MTAWEIHVGDCREVLRSLAAGSVHTVVTSPPYFGLRDYGTGVWEGGDPDHEHHGTHGAGGGSSQNGGGRVGMGGQEHGNGAPNRGGDPARCPCGASRVDEQIGLEPTPDEYVAALVDVFREVRRVLRDDGTVWLNLGDSYAGGNMASGDGEARSTPNGQRGHVDNVGMAQRRVVGRFAGVKPKDLIGIPWLVAFALRADGWYLRSEIIWAKANPMPESVTDRPTKAHEQVFLLSKSLRYFYDADAIREAQSPESLADHMRRKPSDRANGAAPDRGPGDQGLRQNGVMTSGQRNRRSVWTVATQPYAGAHFATFPPKLIEPCILAGCPERCCSGCGAPWVRIAVREDQGHDGSRYGEAAIAATGGAISGGTARSTLGSSNGKLTGKSRTVGFEPSCGCAAEPMPGTVLDPFAGAGTTGMVALRHGRSFVGIELSGEYAELARRRITDDAPLFNSLSERAKGLGT